MKTDDSINAVAGTLLWLTVAAAAALGAGCTSPLPTAPTPQPVADTAIAAPTPDAVADVDPVVIDYTGYTFEHDPNAPGISVCRTQPRMYCSPSGACEDEVDLYTVAAPDTCPAQPIE